jgi:hypothetical protein
MPANLGRPLSTASNGAIRSAASGLPDLLPPGHVGPVALPGSGRMVWWTGRVAIGLRHQPQANVGPLSQSAAWVQALMLSAGADRARHAGRRPAG